MRAVELFGGGGGFAKGFSEAGIQTVEAIELNPSAVRTYNLNHGAVVCQQGDIREWSPRFETPDIVYGGPSCFPAGTLITTSESVIPIEQVQEGQMVLTHTGHYHRVLGTMQRAYKGQLLTIQTAYRREPVTCTPEHPFYVRRRVQTYSEPVWVEAKDLLPGDVLCEPHTKDWQPLQIPTVYTRHVVGAATPPYVVLKKQECSLDWTSTEYAWILGFYLAEGNTRGYNPTLDTQGKTRRRVIFSIADHEAVDISKKLINLGLHPQVQKHGQGSTTITVINKEFWALCQVVGKGAANKYVPEAFHSMPLSWQKEFLDGYFTGDGCIIFKKGIIKRFATTVSPAITRGISKMVARVFSVVSYIHQSHTAGVGTIQGRQVGFVDDMGAWLPIKVITKHNDQECMVYNFEVAVDNSYLANGYSVHNCQGLSTQGKRDPNDARNLLMWEFMRIVRETKPAYFVMENVPALTHSPNVDLLSDLINGFRVAGYRVCEPWLLNAADYGVGQSRRRLFLVGYREDVVGPAEPNPLPLNKCQTAGDVLSKPYSNGVTGTDLTNHSVDVIDRFTACPPGTKEPVSRFMRLSWDKPSPTVTAQGRLIHPLEPRILSVREAARIQSFPDSYQFPKSRVDAYMQIGNAVCPLVAKAIGLSILKAYHLKVR